MFHVVTLILVVVQVVDVVLGAVVVVAIVIVVLVVVVVIVVMIEIFGTALWTAKAQLNLSPGLICVKAVILQMTMISPIYLPHQVHLIHLHVVIREAQR